MQGDLLLSSRLVALQLPFKLFVFVGEDELIRQMILIEVIDKVPEETLVLCIASQLTQIDLIVTLAQHLANVFKQAASALEINFELLVAVIALLCAPMARMSVHLLADRYHEHR